MDPHVVIPPHDAGRAKLAGRAAEQILADVIELGWPVGHVLGSEAALLERYSISRAVLHEAVRLVEHQHVAVMRRGPRGGLVICEPDIDAVISPVILYLMRFDVSLDEVIDARLVLEELVAEIAATRANEDGIDVVRQALRDETNVSPFKERLFHSRLATLTANPVLNLFVDILNQVGDFYYSEPRLSKETERKLHRAHETIARAVLANDPGLARMHMRRHLLAEAEFIRAHGPSIQRLPASAALYGTVGNKRAEALARTMFSDMLVADAGPGTFIGSEATLMNQYGVSRAVFRGAVRILEHHQIAAMRPGRSGGLFVAAPDPSALADIVAIYLRRSGASIADLTQLRTGLELAIVERVADRLAGNEAEAIRRALAGGVTATPYPLVHPAIDWHSGLASLCGNHALELIHRVTMRLGWLFLTANSDPDRAVRRVPDPERIESAHDSITAALLDGDKERAMMRMRAHLAATSAYSESQS